jgi:hypothetical protein
MILIYEVDQYDNGTTCYIDAQIVRLDDHQEVYT